MIWLRTDVVLAIHKRQIAEHGGQGGIRDPALLESALARAQNIAAYESHSDLARLAAAYAFGISQNHPFLDGNKRTALAACRTFLLLNRFTLRASQVEKAAMFIALAAGEIDEIELTDWLRARLESID